MWKVYSQNCHNPYCLVDGLSYGLSEVMGSRRYTKKVQYFIMPHSFLQEWSHSAGIRWNPQEWYWNPQEWYQNPQEWTRMALE